MGSVGRRVGVLTPRAGLDLDARGPGAVGAGILLLARGRGSRIRGAVRLHVPHGFAGDGECFMALLVRCYTECSKEHGVELLSSCV